MAIDGEMNRAGCKEAQLPRDHTLRGVLCDRLRLLGLSIPQTVLLRAADVIE
jgi:hypothetical protein